MKTQSSSQLVFTEQQAIEFAQLSLHCIFEEFPNKTGQIQSEQFKAARPKEITPSFYGCFDWHSAVHGHWALIRLLNVFPNFSLKEQIFQSLSQNLTKENLQKELEYFKRDVNKTFERPYGWAWYLRLTLEVHEYAAKLPAESKGAKVVNEWKAALIPLAQFFSESFTNYLERLSVPLRDGQHANTSFALVHAYDYAVKMSDSRLKLMIEKRARDFYLNDTHYPLRFEPSGEDFISPGFTEALLMSKVLAPSEFSTWAKNFFVKEEVMKGLQLPTINDIKDYKMGHLVGLMLQKGHALQHLSELETAYQTDFQEALKLHHQRASELIFQSGYGGTHWLASFAIALLTKL